MNCYCSFVLKRLEKVGVSHDHCIITDKILPNSCVTLSLATGSRTTVHYRYGEITLIASVLPSVTAA